MATLLKVLCVILVLFHLALLVVNCSTLNQQNTYDISTSGNASSNVTLTLSELANEPDQFFSGATLNFLPGDHTLHNTVLLVSSVGDLTWEGPVSQENVKPARILCTNSSFEFVNVSNLTIANIKFISCGIALSFTEASFINTTFENSTGIYGGAIAACNGSKVSFDGRNGFVGNKAIKGGGAIFAHSSSFKFLSETNFQHNEASVPGGGAVFLFQSDVSFNGYTRLDSNQANETVSVRQLPKGTGLCSLQDSYALNFTGYDDLNHTASGGGLLAWQTTLTFNGTNTFADNGGIYGGALYLLDSKVKFSGNSSFISNKATGQGGGAFYTEYTNLDFLGTTSFRSNSGKDYGGGISAWDGSNLTFYGETSFHQNRAKLYGGGLLLAVRSYAILTGTNTFHDNHIDVYYGGGIAAIDRNTLFLNGMNDFWNNTAKLNGGAVYVERTSASFLGRTRFDHNTARYFGGAVSIDKGQCEFGGISNFSNNTGKFGGAIFAEFGELTVMNESNFTGNVAFTPLEGLSTVGEAFGGAIHSSSSKLKFQGQHKFLNNTSDNGGAIALTGVDDGVLFLFPNTTLDFELNYANATGGALLVDDNPFTQCMFKPQPSVACFFQLFVEDCYPSPYMKNVINTLVLNNTHFVFKDNHALKAGNVVYGGLVATCSVCLEQEDGMYYMYKIFDEMSKFITTIDEDCDQTNITSDPERVCICLDGTPDCERKFTTPYLYPGETTYIEVVGVGQLRGTVPTIVGAASDNESLYLKLNESDYHQSTTKFCTAIKFTPHVSNATLNSEIKMRLYPGEPCEKLGFPAFVTIRLRPCPDGFTLSNDGICDCDKRLEPYNITCYIQNQTFLRRGNYWIGFHKENKSRGLIIHEYCPKEYCTNKTIFFSLATTDLQCLNNRSDILCGSCSTGLSLSFGSSHCVPCSTTFLALVLPFALAGIAVVFFLFLCQLTIADGTMGGLIFYANIVEANRGIFFRFNQPNILTVFIAWLNLDLGIHETCFFNGMDEYSKTWLQLVFPLYIWAIVGLVAYLSNKSIFLGRLTRSANPTLVMATVILLSIAKLIRVMIAAFAYTIVAYPKGQKRLVWLFDGNVTYFGHKHACFLLSLLFFLFIFVPYTLSLFFGRWIHRHMEYRFVSRNIRFHYNLFIDAYLGPYKETNEYWSGLLVLLRLYLFVFSGFLAIADPGKPEDNLLMVLVVIACLVVWNWVTRGIYKNWHLDVLEITFLMNLFLFCTITHSILKADDNIQTAISMTSVGVAFLTFLGILVYKLSKQVKRSRIWRRLRRVKQRQRQQFFDFIDHNQMDEYDRRVFGGHAQPTTHTIIDRPTPQLPLPLPTMRTPSPPTPPPTFSQSRKLLDYSELREPLDMVSF